MLGALQPLWLVQFTLSKKECYFTQLLSHSSRDLKICHRGIRILENTHLSMKMFGSQLGTRLRFTLGWSKQHQIQIFQEQSFFSMEMLVILGLVYPISIFWLSVFNQMFSLLITEVMETVKELQTKKALGLMLKQLLSIFRLETILIKKSCTFSEDLLEVQ